MNIGIIGCGWLGKDLSKTLINQYNSVFGTKTTIEGIKELEHQNIPGTLLKLTENTVEINEQQHFTNAEVLIISITPRLRKRDSKSAIEEMKTLTRFLKDLPQNPHVIYLNSTAVYNSTIDNCTEDISNLKSPYKDFEEIISTLPNYTILRLAGLVGPDRIIINRMAGKERKISKTAPVNLVAKEDVIASIHSVLENLKAANKEVFNVCSSEHPLKHIFYTEMCYKAGLEPPKFTFTNQDEHKKVVNLKIKRVLQPQLQYEKIEDYFNEILNKKL